jgi:PIN domain nuclease of toxin-antitoxin system
LLLDSHAFVWWAEANQALSATARLAITDQANEVLVSVAGLWELVIKSQLGKLPSLPDDVETMLANQGFSLLPINFLHLRRYALLQQLHKDPFDRMMIARHWQKTCRSSRATGFLLPTACRSSGSASYPYSAAGRCRSRAVVAASTEPSVWNATR